MIVVDSSVWIANLRNEKRSAVSFLNEQAEPSTIIVGDVVLLEVLRGAQSERHAAEIELRLRRFRVETMLSPDLAAAAARHYRALRRTGTTVGKIADLIIATFCIDRGYELLHDDQDFSPFVAQLGLRVTPIGARGR